jgi:16S rRNA (cytidine1402-2'-O)-methyltransferase
MRDNLYQILDFFDMKPELFDIRILKSTNTMFADEYQVQECVDFIKEGRTVLLVAGEGQVGIADPGNQFIQACIENDLFYTIYPGPSSHITAFVASGITNGDFFISCNMEYPEKTIEYFKDQDTPLVIPIWQHRLDEIIELLDTKFKFTNNKNKKVTLCCDMTANEELFITDWVDKIAKNEKLKEIRPYAKIMLVVSDFIKQ